MDKIPVGILGATGVVGQRFVHLLSGHPWFRLTALAASERSAGQAYGAVCRWLLPTPMPDEARGLTVRPLAPGLDCRLVFSALPGDVAGPVEETFAQAGYAVCSNASVHRCDPDVPLLIPEVNADHTALIAAQRRQRPWSGLLVTSPNCLSTPLALALKPLHDAFILRRLLVVSMQAISGAGYPGIPAADVLGNVIPFIAGEEDKVEREPLKLLGALRGDRIIDAPATASAQCNRVPVADGHTACVSAEFERRPTVEQVAAALESFSSPAGVAELPSSPPRPLLLRPEADRPQPLRDRDAAAGMAVCVGRLRPCPVLSVKFVVLGHNTLRGAAGGAIHNAELLVSQGWI